jgi:hypothetical protein
VLIGGAALTDEAYPISAGWQSDEGWGATFLIHAATEERGNFGHTVLRQEVELELTASEERVQSVAWETLRSLADSLAFAAGQRVEIKLPSISNGRPGFGEPATRTIITMTVTRMPDRLVRVPIGFLGVLWDRIEDPTGERGRKIVRAMRWLRRSIGALDEVEEFTVLAFGLEAVADLLPVPDQEWLNALRQSQRVSAEDAPDHSEILRHFAVRVCGLTTDAWRKVGGPRHRLFHGGLTEDADTAGLLGEAIPILRAVLIKAIKHTIQLRENEPPHDRSSPIIPGNVQFSFSGPLEFLPPSAEMPERPPMLVEQEDRDIAEGGAVT